MKSYYSIISAAIRPQIGEYLTIGFCLVGENEVLVDFSKQKISLVRQLMSENRYNGLNSSVRSILNAKNKLKNDSGLWDESFNVRSSSFSEQYLNYLSAYNNNIILFTKPAVIDIDVNQEIFTKLFQKYVDNSYPSESIDKLKKQNSFYRFKKERLPELKPYYNTEFRITSDLFPELIMPVKLDLVGKNDIAVFGKSINLERITYHVREDLSNLLLLEKAVPESKRFVISKEPNKIHFKQQHSIWQDIHKSSWFEYVDLSEVEKLEEYATSHGVLPLFGEEE